MSRDVDRYRARVQARHGDAFALFRLVSGTVERAILTPRAYHDLPGIVLDMFMTQAHKAYASVSILSQHGLMEDSATIARRLMELGVQAIYVGMETDDRVRRRKAGRYLAFMWRQLPRHLKERLPPEVRSQWTGIGRGYGRFVKKSAKTWGPNWRDMFSEIGALDAYESDYGFLAGIAHGRADHQVFVYSANNVRLHDDRFVSVLLAYATKYYLLVVDAWNREVELIEPATMDELRDRAVKFTPTPAAGEDDV